MSITPITSISTGQVAYWDFHDNSGTTASDGSGSGNDGELISFGGGAFVDGKVGKALDLDGAGSMVVVEDSASLNGLSHEASIAFWMRLRSYGEEESAGSYTRESSYVLRKGDHLGIKVINDPGTVTRTLTIRSGIGADGGAAGRMEINAPQGSILLDTRIIAIVYRNNTIALYRDGIPMSAPARGTVKSTTCP